MLGAKKKIKKKEEKKTEWLWPSCANEVKIKKKKQTRANVPINSTPRNIERKAINMLQSHGLLCRS